ncbi:hypothetical protein ALQ79_200382 [Pseudomonas amygdali pv. lachrymans]|nr:hypothetical protein ALQ79_200382 [Pseudomonas amygdali pv. lachrymans]
MRSPTLNNASLPWRRVALSAMMIALPAYATAQTLEVQNLKPITSGMNGIVVLKVVGSASACTYMGKLVQIAAGQPNERWVVKADQRSCLKSARGDMTMARVEALAPINTFPIPKESNLILYVRE